MARAGGCRVGCLAVASSSASHHSQATASSINILFTIVIGHRSWSLPGTFAFPENKRVPNYVQCATPPQGTRNHPFPRPSVIPLHFYWPLIWSIVVIVVVSSNPLDLFKCDKLIKRLSPHPLSLFVSPHPNPFEDV